MTKANNIDDVENMTPDERRRVYGWSNHMGTSCRRCGTRHNPFASGSGDGVAELWGCPECGSGVIFDGGGPASPDIDAAADRYMALVGASQQKPATMGKAHKGPRGFPILLFMDRNGNECSLQCSSVITSDRGFHEPGTSAVWLGLSSASPEVLASDAASVGVETTQTTGWVPYPVPKNVLLSTRMHLNRKQVRGLIARLREWLQKGHWD